MQHLLDSFAVLIHLFPIAPVLLSDLPLLVSHSLTFTKPPQLLVRVDVEPELEQDRPKVYQVLLHTVDLSVSPPPLGLGAEPFHALDQHAAIPGPVRDCDGPDLGSCAQKRHK